MLAGLEASIRWVEPILLIFANELWQRLRAVAFRVIGQRRSTAIRWVERLRNTGSVAPSKIGGYKPRAIAGEHRTWLLARIKEKDFTLLGLVGELGARGLKVDYRSVWSFVHDEKLSFKKTIWDGVAPVGVETLGLYRAPGRERPSAFWWRVTP